jgi:WD40 repeat protein
VLHGPVRVPDEAAQGIAKVTLSFDAWNDGRVTSAQLEVPIVVWELKASDPLRATLAGHSSAVWSMAISPDGRTLAAGSTLGQVKLWDVTTRQERATLQSPADSSSYTLTLSPDGQTVAVGYWQQNRLKVSGEVKLWDVATGKPRATLTYPRPRGVTWVAFAPDGKTLAATEGWFEEGEKRLRGEVALWDIATGKVRATIKEDADTLAFAPDGKTLAIATGKGISLWDAASAQEGGTFAKLPAYGMRLVYSPDGKTLAGAEYQGTVTIWDVATRTVKGILRHEGERRVLSAAFAPDGKTLAVPLGNLRRENKQPGEVVLWDLNTLRRVATLQGHTGEVFSVAFSPDGKTLASGSSDNTVKLWDLTRLLVGQPSGDKE